MLKYSYCILMRFKALVTDLDGTLVTLPIDWDKLRERVRKILKTNHPLKPIAPNVPKAARGDPILIEKAFKLIEKEELKASESVKFDEELYEFFQWIKWRGMKVGLVTLQGRRSAKRTLERLGILKFFDSIVTRENSLMRCEQLLVTLRKLNTKPSETIFVGDTRSDIIAGKELGLFMVIVGSKSYEVKGDMSVSKITELQSLLGRVID